MSIVVVLSGTRTVIPERDERLVRGTMQRIAERFEVSEWRVGDCSTGVDLTVRSLKKLFPPMSTYEASWKTEGYSAGPKRNRVMMESPTRADLLLAFPVPGGSGTQDCIRQALILNVDMIVTWLGEKFEHRRAR